MKKYVTPEASEIHVDFENNLAMEFDPSQSTDIQLVKERDDDFDNQNMKEDRSWTTGLW